jgi:hypothetical protein
VRSLVTWWPFGPRRAAQTAPEGTAQHFHEDVVACMEALNPRLRRLRSRYTDPALASALAMHTVGALSACIREGSMTREQARHIVWRIGELEFGEGSFFGPWHRRGTT